MKKYSITILLSIILLGNLFAQKNDSSIAYLYSASSPNGNYVFLKTNTSSNLSDSIYYANTDYFVIERVLSDSISISSNEYKKIATVKCVQTEAELKYYLTDEYIEELKKALKLKTNKDLVSYFKLHKSPKNFGLYELSLDVQMAMGYVYLDKNVLPGKTYKYNIKRVTKDKTENSVGNCFVTTGAGNRLMPFLKPKSFDTKAYDSSIYFYWKVPVSEKYLNSLKPAPTMVLKTATGEILDLQMPLPPSTFRANVFLQTAQGWQKKETSLGSMNKTNDTLTFSYIKKTVPDELAIAYIKLEDMVYNQGLESDTAYAFAVEKKRLPLLMGIKVEDIVDGIKITWKPLPPKPYILGVQILRYNSQDVLDTVGIVGLNDSVYYDYNIKVGQTYRYNAKAFYIPQIKLTQEFPAQGIGQYTKFSKPQPPYELTAQNEKKNIRLNWEFDDHPSFYAFYIYRGTSPKNLTLIAGPIKTKTFLDTATSLSGRSEYSYTVVTQNLRQDTSIYSNIVSIKSDRKIETTFPKAVTFYYANGKVNVMWDDVRKMDNAIESFIVQKKNKTDKTFTLITKKAVTENTLIDSVIEAGATYLYKVACISFKGDTSEYSNASEFILAKKDVDIVDVFYVRNIKEAVEVSLPTMEFEDRKLYNIYRREATATALTKIGSIPANTYAFEDKTAKPKVLYVYTITVTNKDGREGVRGKSISVRKD